MITGLFSWASCNPLRFAPLAGVPSSPLTPGSFHIITLSGWTSKLRRFPQSHTSLAASNNLVIIHKINSSFFFSSLSCVDRGKYRWKYTHRCGIYKSPRGNRPRQLPWPRPQWQSGAMCPCQLVVVNFATQLRVHLPTVMACEAVDAAEWTTFVDMSVHFRKIPPHRLRCIKRIQLGELDLWTTCASHRHHIHLLQQQPRLHLQPRSPHPRYVVKLPIWATRVSSSPRLSFLRWTNWFFS